MDEVGKVAGDDARSRMHALAAFEATGIRPLIDMVQGWDLSI
jgi:hypothetical protein